MDQSIKYLIAKNKQYLTSLRKAANTAILTYIRSTVQLNTFDWYQSSRVTTHNKSLIDVSCHFPCNDISHVRLLMNSSKVPVQTVCIVYGLHSQLFDVRINRGERVCSRSSPPCQWTDTDTKTWGIREDNIVGDARCDPILCLKWNVNTHTALFSR